MSVTTTDRPLTDQQRRALETRDRSVSLAAGAGCGKTFVLTERFLAHVDPTREDAGDLEELVAITFTDAAAREMRDRIRRRCFERLQAATSKQEAAAWQRLMRSMDAARISTIHAFCTQLLRKHAVELGLDPQFEVLDAAAAELLKLETVDDRLRSLLLDGKEEVLELAAKRGLERLRNDLAALSGPRADEAIERWIDATPEDVVAEWQEFHATTAAPQALKEFRRSPALIELRTLCDPAVANSDKLATRMVELDEAIDCLATSDASKCADTLAKILAEARVTDVRGEKHWHNADDYDRFRDVCAKVRDLIKGCPLAAAPDFSMAHEAAAQGLALLRLVADVNASLQDAKTGRNQLEFDDLLTRTEKLLVDPANVAIRQHIAETTRLLMVDEFQDTNPLQVRIIKAFCGDDWQERGLFAVGDFKQSIYRFNGAEPQVSIDLRHELSPAGRLSLTRNFRSQPAITDFVNAIFCEEFEDYEPLVPARRQATPTPAVEFLWTPGESATADASEAENLDGEPAAKKGRRAGAVRDARALEARWMARRLVQLLRSPAEIVVGKDGAPRRLELGDVAILLRTLSDAQVYEEALRDHGLEYYLAGGHAFYSQQEIYDVLNLLRAVASTVDEIALAGALRSPFFSLADETLFWLVHAHGTLNAALAAASPADNLSKEEAAKVRRAAATLARLRMEKDRLLVADLFALALELTGYDAVLLTEFLGPRKAANIDKLLEQARVLDRTSPGDLQGFITQLSEFVTRAPKEALAATQAEGDVIRIMTIHYAKGLEFPLVVLPDLDRQRHGGSSQPVLDVELGPLVPLDDEQQQGCTGLKLYQDVEKIAELDERKRLLYVACTRSADYLILSSSMDDPARPKRDWLQLVDQAMDLTTGALRRPLPAGYGTPAVRVITEKPRIDDDKVTNHYGADLERLVHKTRERAEMSSGEIPRSCDQIPVDRQARRRFSFSQLTGAIVLEDERAAARDLAMAEGLIADEAAADGRDLGTLVHAVLERLVIQHPTGVQELCEYLAPRYTDGDPAPLAATATKLVERFLQSPRAAELAAAKLVRRELEFLLPWPLDGQRLEGRYLHGYIDCLYQDREGRWRLLDYKTNRTSANGVPQVAKQYELQLLVYSLACEQALGEPLAECTLHLLHPSQEYTFHWNAADKTAAIEGINVAIEVVTGKL